MTMTRWDPFAGFDRLFDMLGRSSQRRVMPMDVYRKDGTYTVEMDLPGVDPSSIDVNVEGRTLTVTAEAHSQHEEAEEVVCERMHTRFYRQVYLGENLELDRVNATYDNGVLRIEIPMQERSGGRRVEVSSSASGSRQVQPHSNGGESG